MKTLKSMPPKKTTDPLELDQQLCFSLYSSSLAMSKRYKPHLEALGLTYPQYVAMLVLWEQDGLSVSEMGERLFLDSGTLTPLLKRLEAAGLVQRQRDSTDERRVQLTLTAQGRRLKAKAAKVPACIFQATGCSVQQARALTEQLQQLRERLLAP
jgi:DNA-binding MarR family transcriptional regulator